MLKQFLICCFGLFLLGYGSVFAQEEEYEKGLEAYQNEEYDRAEALFNEALNNRARNEDEIYYWIGMSYYRRDAYSQAKEYFRKGVEDKSRSALNHAGLGMINMIEQNYSTANEELEAAIDYGRRKNLEVSFAVAEAYLQGGPAEIRNAKQILYPLKSEYPDDPRTYLELGTYYKETGVPSLAIEELERAIELRDGYIPAYVMLAELYYEKGKESNEGADFEKAFDYANQAIEKDPDFAPAYRTRAEVYLLLKQYGKARDDMQKYVNLTQGDLRAELRYASFLFLTEDYEQAIERLDAIDTTTQLKRRLLGIANYELGNMEEAKQHMDEYFQNTKKDEYIIWQDYKVYGDIFRAQGKLDSADKYYVKMIMKSDEQSGYFETLAEQYLSKAKAIAAQASQMRSEAREAQKAASQAYQQYNQILKKKEDGGLTQEDADKAKELKAEMDAAVAKGKRIIAAREEKLKEAKPFYALEAHYRQLVVDYQEAESLQNYYNLAKAHYKAEQWEEALPSFKKVIELKEDYTPPYNYWMQIANKMEAADTTSMEWMVVEPAELVLENFGDKAASELDKGEKRLLIVANEVMAGYKFNPSGGKKPEDYHCEEAMPYVESIQTIDPDYTSSFVESLVDYCSQQR